MKKLFTVLSIFVLSYTQAQNILIVDNDPVIDTSPAHMFNNITDAISAANNGDIIYVQPSLTSYGAVTINKEITLFGSGYAPELNDGRRSELSSVRIDADNIKISGFYISTYITYNSSTSTSDNIIIEDNFVNQTIFVGSTNAGHTTTNNNWIIRGNVINFGITLHADPTKCINTVITNNHITLLNGNATASYALRYFNDTTIFNNNVVRINHTWGNTNIFPNMTGDVTAFNNIFISNGINTLFTPTTGRTLTLNNSISYMSTGGTLSLAMPGTGNFDNQNPFFTSVASSAFDIAPEDDFTLSPSSVGLNAGSDGNDIGIYNGDYDFDMRGYPTELPYLTSFTISNNLIEAGENINVNVKANANKSN